MKSIQKRRYLMESEAYRKESDTYLHFSRRMFGTVFSAGLLGILTGCQIESSRVIPFLEAYPPR